ncbi:trace amine-associated receptor 7g-like [Branchiostoma lanceolatum]|uniref:trace amine-associated receptor 7g-like n=1 Tax=Branchiostoma lanceolatum TaxID=7740 RepID=UPI003454B76A
MIFSNNSTVTNSSLETIPEAALPVEPGVIITEAVLAIVGNLLVILSSGWRQTFPPAGRLFVFSMACSDLLLGVSFAVSVAPAEAGRWIYADEWAQIIATAECSFHTLTAIALAGLNLDRHYVLKSNRGLSGRKSKLFMFLAWIGILSWYGFSAAYGVPVEYDPIIARPVFDLSTFVWFTVVSFALFSAAGTAALFCVTLVLKALCCHQDAPPAQQPGVFHINLAPAAPQIPPQAAQNGDDVNARWYAKVVLLLTIGQLLTYLPYSCGLLLREFTHVDVPPTFIFWSYWATCFNTCVDVVVYSVLQQSFRTAVYEMAVSVICGVYNVCCRKNRVDPTADQVIELTSL